MIKKIIFMLSPFIVFFVSYIFFAEYMHKDSINVPEMVGKNISDVVRLLYEQNLCISVSAIVSDKTCKGGTVISQYPQEGVKILSHMPIHLEIVESDDKQAEPHVCGKYIDDALYELDIKGYSYSIYEIDACYAENFVYAQALSHRKNFDGGIVKHINLFVVKKAECEKLIVENIQGHFCKDIVEVCGKKNIKVICYGHEYDHNKFVVHQMPEPFSHIKSEETIYLWH